MSYLVVAESFEALAEDGAAVLGALAAVGEELGQAVVEAMVVLGGDRVVFKRGVDLSCPLRHWRVVVLARWRDTRRLESLQQRWPGHGRGAHHCGSSVSSLVYWSRNILARK